MNDEKLKMYLTILNSENPSHVKENAKTNIIILVEKQQKEIEKLKEDYQILKDDIEGHNVAYVDTPEFEENYISKDKIKEKIEELEKYVNEFEEYWSKDPRQFKKEKCIDYYKLEALKDLLGEIKNE